MIGMTAFRRLSHDFAGLAVRHGGGGTSTALRQDKSAAFGRAHVVGGIDVFAHCDRQTAGASGQKCCVFNGKSAVAPVDTAWRHP
jgi:hypothetical protein